MKRQYYSGQKIKKKPDLKLLNKIKDFISNIKVFKMETMPAKKRRKTTNNRKKRLVIYNYISTFILGAVILGLFSIIGVFAVFSRELPNPNQLLERSFELSTRFYDRNDSLIYEVYGDKNRTLIQFEDINPSVLHATLAIEDSDFYLHKGYSIRGMARAAKNTILGEGLQGGSTLTQQVIKNTLLSQERTVVRKIKEFILSLQLENIYSKEEILQMYLNEAPYGGQNYGIYSGAKAYFNKQPQDLTLAESAYLAGLPQRPSYYSQFGIKPEAGIERKNYVLYLMNERGWIGADGKRYYLSNEEYEEARNTALDFETSKVPLEAPHFVYYAKQYLIDLLGEDVVESGGLKVKTTLDLDMQNMAQDIVYSEIEDNKFSLNVYNGAMVVLDTRTSGILAMVGSKGYNLDTEPEDCTSGATGDTGCKFDPYVNVTLSERQPGSAIKPITYATMLSQGYTAAFPFLDVPSRFQGSSPNQPYDPVNYDGIYRGVMPLRKSLGNSLNIPAVKALAIAGVDNMIDQAEKMGISTFTDRNRYGLALTLGGGETTLLELSGAFAVFGNKGLYNPPTPIIEVRNSQDKVVYKPSVKGTRALSEEVAFLISDILSDNGARSAVFGTNSLLNISGYEVAVKTGTTDDKRDNYAVGYTPSIVAGVWVGNNNNEAMNPYVASGISGASPIWNKFMVQYLSDKDNEEFEHPTGVHKVVIDELTGGLPYDGFSSREEWFIKGTEPTAKSDWYTRLEICKIDNLIANAGCKDADKTETENFVKIKAELPKWQPSVDAWVKENYEDDTYFPPQMVSKLEFDGDEVENKDDVYVQITEFEDNQEVPLQFRLNVEVSAYNDIDEVRIYLDGERVTADSNFPWGYNFDFNSSDIGDHEFEAVAEDEDGNEGSDSIRLFIGGYEL